jgi:hypothetical protein
MIILLNNLVQVNFVKIGVELKVSGFINFKKSDWSVKERILLSQINSDYEKSNAFIYLICIHKKR